MGRDSEKLLEEVYILRILARKLPYKDPILCQSLNSLLRMDFPELVQKLKRQLLFPYKAQSEIRRNWQIQGSPAEERRTLQSYAQNRALALYFLQISYTENYWWGTIALNIEHLRGP